MVHHLAYFAQSKLSDAESPLSMHHLMLPGKHEKSPKVSTKYPLFINAWRWSWNWARLKQGEPFCRWGRHCFRLLNTSRCMGSISIGSTKTITSITYPVFSNHLRTLRSKVRHPAHCLSYQHCHIKEKWKPHSGLWQEKTKYLWDLKEKKRSWKRPKAGFYIHLVSCICGWHPFHYQTVYFYLPIKQGTQPKRQKIERRKTYHLASEPVAP